MYKLLGLFLLLTPLPLAANPVPGDWKPFSSKDGGYEVQMPGMPKEERPPPVKTSVGNVYVNLAVLELNKGEGSYVVGYSELPEAAVKADTEEKRLDNARDGAVHSSKGKLKSEKALKLDEYLGREFVIQIDAKMGVRTRLYAIKNRLYQVMAVGTKELIESKDTAKFLDSFKLVK